MLWKTLIFENQPYAVTEPFSKNLRKRRRNSLVLYGGYVGNKKYPKTYRGVGSLVTINCFRNGGIYYERM